MPFNGRISIATLQIISYFIAILLVFSFISQKYDWEARVLSIFLAVFYLFFRLKLEKYLRDHGQKTNALIISIDDKGIGHYKHVTLNLHLEPTGYPAFNAKRRVPRYSHNPFHAGDNINILFDPENPKDFILEDPSGEDKKKH